MITSAQGKTSTRLFSTPAMLLRNTLANGSRIRSMGRCTHNRSLSRLSLSKVIITNVVYVATENDSVYAFDADQVHAVAPLWKTSFLHPPAVTTVPATDVFGKYPQRDIEPSVGITATPVIDLMTNTIYVVAMTKEHGKQYVQSLHALDITTGADKPGSPVRILASVQGDGYDKSTGRPPLVLFNARQANQRPALLLLNGVVYIAWGSFGDTDLYHGWVIGYSYNVVGFPPNRIFKTNPDRQERGRWVDEAGPSTEAPRDEDPLPCNGHLTPAQ